MHPVLKSTGDIVAPGITAMSLLGWLPHIAAALSIVWYAWQIHDKWKTKRAA